MCLLQSFPGAWAAPEAAAPPPGAAGTNAAPGRAVVLAQQREAVRNEMESVNAELAALQRREREQYANLRADAMGGGAGALAAGMEDEEVQALARQIREAEAALADLKARLEQKIASSEAYKARQAQGAALRVEMADLASKRQQLVARRMALVRRLVELDRLVQAETEQERAGGGGVAAPRD